jgi:hypothetical protein
LHHLDEEEEAPRHPFGWTAQLRTGRQAVRARRRENVKLQATHNSLAYFFHRPIEVEKILDGWSSKMLIDGMENDSE